MTDHRLGYLIYHPHRVLKITFESLLRDDSFNVSTSLLKSEISKITHIPEHHIELTIPTFQSTYHQHVYYAVEQPLTDLELET